MLIDIKAISSFFRYLQKQRMKKAVIVTDFTNTLRKVQNKYLYFDWFFKTVPLKNVMSLVRP